MSEETSQLGPSENDAWDDVQEDPEMSDGPQQVRIQQIEHRKNKKEGSRLNILLTAIEGEYQGVFHQLNLPFPGQGAEYRKVCLRQFKQFAALFRVPLPPTKDDANVMASFAIENWTNAEGGVTLKTVEEEYQGETKRRKEIVLPRLKS